MKQLGMTRGDCTSSLQLYINEIDKLIETIDCLDTRDPAAISCTQDVLQNLKSCFANDYKIRQSVSGSSKMSDVESAMFFPAIAEARTRIYVKVNSIPNQKWLDDLYDVRGRLEYYLLQFNDS